MGSEFLTYQQDPSWGSLATNIAKSITGAPKAALDQKLTVEHIVALRQKQAEDKAKFDAAVAAGNTAADAIATAGPPETTRNIPIERQGPSNPDDPNTPLGEVFLPPTVYQEKYVDPKVEARYKAELPFYQAVARAQAHQGAGDLPGVYAKGRVGLSGVPSDPEEQNRLQFQTTGRFRTGEEKSVPANHTLAVIGLDGQPTGQRVTTNNNKTEFGTNRPLFGPGGAVPEGHTLATTGPTDPTPKVGKDEARQRLAVFAKSGAPPTPAQAAQIEQLVSIAWPPERVVEKVGDRQVVKHVQKEPIPPWVVRMMQPTAAPAGTTAATTDPAATAAVDPNADRVIETQPGSAIELRKEYASLPEIKRYANTAVTWNSVIESAYTGNKAADLDIVYGFIKMMDDLTGVREGETKMVGQVGSWEEQIRTLKGQATGEGLDPVTRVNIIKTMQQHMGGIRDAALEKEKFYAQSAADSGLAPRAVLAPLMPMKPFDEARALAVRGVTAPAATGGRRGAAAPATAPPPASTTVEQGTVLFGR
jgi:hypothetical protein